MIVKAEQPDSYLWHVIDNDTDKEIRGVIWANDETKELERYDMNEDGTPKYTSTDFVTIKEKRNFRLVKEGEKS
ncbi:MAG: hypothetical protein ACTSPD_10280 [Promethearchaeota archaeon]